MASMLITNLSILKTLLKGKIYPIRHLAVILLCQLLNLFL